MLFSVLSTQLADFIFSAKADKFLFSAYLLISLPMWGLLFNVE